MANRRGGEVEAVTNFLFLGSNITVDVDCSHEIRRCLLLGKKAMTNLDSIWKSRHHFADTGPYGQSYGLSSSHVWMWELDHKESWAPKNWYFQIVVLEKTLESPLGSKEIKPVNPKGSQPWIFIGRTGAEAEAPILWQRTTGGKKILTLGKIEGKRRRQWQRMRWLDSITDSGDMDLCKLQEMVENKGV